MRRGDVADDDGLVFQLIKRSIAAHTCQSPHTTPGAKTRVQNIESNSRCANVAGLGRTDDMSEDPRSIVRGDGLAFNEVNLFVKIALPLDAFRATLQASPTALPGNEK